MSIAQKLECDLSQKRGFYRVKAGKQKRYKLRSYFIFKNWIRDPLTGAFLGAAKVNDALMKESADLISSCIFNSATGTDTCYGIPFDIDAGITHQKWLSDDGSVSWSKVGTLIADELPELSISIGEVTRSTGGKGFGILVPISPLELVPSTIKGQRKARALQRMIIRILKSYGIGSDPSADGLKRDMPNWRNPQKRIDCNFGRMEEVTRQRIPVVSLLLKALSRHPAVYVKRSEHPERFLATDSRAEIGLARLYEYLFDEFSDPCLTFSEILTITDLSRMSLTKYLRVSPPAWLGVQYLGRAEGYRLTLKPTHILTARAADVLRPKFTVSGELAPPEEVADGERNAWLKQLILRMKWAGVEMRAAGKVAMDLASQIPDALKSRNVREIPLKIRSYYYRYEDLFGIRDRDILPEFVTRLLPDHEKTADVIAMPYRMSKSGMKKGESVSPRLETSKKLRIVSDDFSASETSAAKNLGNLLIMVSSELPKFEIRKDFDWRSIEY